MISSRPHLARASLLKAFQTSLLAHGPGVFLFRRSWVGKTGDAIDSRCPPVDRQRTDWPDNAILSYKYNSDALSLSPALSASVARLTSSWAVGKKVSAYASQSYGSRISFYMAISTGSRAPVRALCTSTSSLTMGSKSLVVPNMKG